MTILPLLLLAVSPIQIDGNFDDWEQGVRETEDQHYIYKRITLPTEQCLQQLPEQMTVTMGELDILFSPRNRDYGVSCIIGGRKVSPYSVGLVYSPTFASTEFELRIDKNPMKKLTTSFDLSPKESLRVVSWNVQFGSLFDDTERASRILQALKPDVLLLQELDGDDTPKSLATFLGNTLEGKWNVTMSPVWGEERHEQLRSAIATKLPMEDLPQKYPSPHKTVFANINVEGKTYTFVSVHLRCCGGPLSEAESQRQNEAGMIQTIVKNIHSDGVVIAGDWNLVGTKKPLTTVQGKDFTPVYALQPDGALTATWSDANSPFTPGRLDWMLVSTKSIEATNSFVLDTTDLNQATLSKYKLRKHDTILFSDHLPLVADLRIRSNVR